MCTATSPCKVCRPAVMSHLHVLIVSSAVVDCHGMHVFDAFLNYELSVACINESSPAAA